MLQVLAAIGLPQAVDFVPIREPILPSGRGTWPANWTPLPPKRSIRGESMFDRSPACVLAVLLLASSLANPARGATFTNVATHPDAAAQSTTTGRVLATLHPFNGKIYAGFGDYGANTGPIGIRPFDPATGTFGNRLLNSGTEAVYIYRNIDGRLYAPHIDPIAGESSGGYARGTASGLTETWIDRFPVTAVHMFDMASYGGSLWMVGSQGNNAAVWRSTDAGATWQLSLSVAPTTSPFIRFYGVAPYDGKLYVQRHEANSTSNVFDGTSWTDGPDLIPGGGYMWHPENFAGKLVYMSGHAGIGSSPLYAFDGTSAQTSFWIPGTGGSNGTSGGIGGIGVRDFVVHGDAVFALGSDQLIRTSTDLTTWTVFATAPAEARSLAILNDQLFLGGSNSAIYEYSQPIPEPAGIAALVAVALTLRRNRAPLAPARVPANR